MILNVGAGRHLIMKCDNVIIRYPQITEKGCDVISIGNMYIPKPICVNSDDECKEASACKSSISSESSI